MVKSISFIALTQFFNFNELKVLRQPGYFIFFTVKPTIFCTILYGNICFSAALFQKFKIVNMLNEV